MHFTRTAAHTAARFAVVAALIGAAPAAMAAMAAPSPATFVAKAGASDKFEIDSSKLVSGSTNPGIKSYAQKMIADHTKSTADVKTAATADHVVPKPPMLDAKQKSDIAALKAASGAKRDALYVQQQKASHQKALALMEGYSTGGSAAHLKAVATATAPVVKGHLDMVDQMPAM